MTAAAIGDLLRTAPLTGAESIFGNRAGDEIAPAGGTRRLAGFSPAPGFRFDVDLEARPDDAFVVRFSQPQRRTPYLAGEFLWTLRDDPDGALFDEQINTAEALRVVARPLGGERPSPRRWLFFRTAVKKDCGH